MLRKTILVWLHIMLALIGNYRRGSLSVVAHYVSSNGQKEKKILGRRLIHVTYNGENVAEGVQSDSD